MRPRRRFAPEPPRPARNELVNENIRSAQVRLIDEDGAQLGIKPTKEALEIAWAKNLDLVVVAAQADPPVARVMDHSKYKYEQEQKAKLARKHQLQVNIKEIKFRPKIGIHDYETKKGHVVRFLKQRAKVKVTIMFRGREQQHPERGRDLLMRLAEDIKEIGVIESAPLLEGRNMTMLMAPTKTAGEETQMPKQKTHKQREEALQGDGDGQAAAPARRCRATISSTSQPSVSARSGSDQPVAPADVRELSRCSPEW